MNSIKDLQNSYRKILSSYMQKKQEPWKELLNSWPELNVERAGTLLDIGTGNGRNLKFCKRTLVVGLDLSFDLLQKFMVEHPQRVAGSLPKLPFRSECADEVLSVAVIHHLITDKLRTCAIKEFFRLTIQKGKLIATVWRKWRPSYRQRLFVAIREQRDVKSLIDHNRPWRSSTGDIIAYRFYHYYTRKELLQQVNTAGYKDITINKMGGKSKEENFIVIAKK